MGRLSARRLPPGRAGHGGRAGLESKVMKTGCSDFDRSARGPAAVGAGVVCRQDRRGQAGGSAAGRPHHRQGILRDHQGRRRTRPRTRSRSRWSRRVGRRRSRPTKLDAQGHARRKKLKRRPRKSRRAANRRRSPIRSPRRSRSTDEPEEESRRAEAEAAAAARSRRRSSSRKFDPTRSRRCSTSAIRSATPRPARSSTGSRRSARVDGAAARLSQSEIDALRRALYANAGSRRSARPTQRTAGRDPGAVQAGRHGGDAARDVVGGNGPAPFGRRWPKAPSARSCVPAVHDAAARALTTTGKTSRSRSIRSDMFGGDISEIEKPNDRDDRSLITRIRRPAATRRRLCCAAALPLAAAGRRCCRARPAPRCSVDVTQGNVQPMPIALPDFVGGAPTEAEIARNVTGVIANNLQRSGLFAPIDPAPSSRRSPTSTRCRAFADWRVINAQALVTGRITRKADGRLKAEFRLWDVFAGQQLAGKQYFTTPDNWRRIAHIISDAIYERLTGEKGYFDSRIVFVDETGPKERRVKRLAIMDQDGANVRYPDARRRSGADAALHAVDAGNHLHVLRAGRAARLSAQHRDRPARGRRQFPRHDLRAALLARRPARDHEPAAGQQLQSLRDGSALEADDAAHRHAGDRHRAVLFAGRHAHLLRERPRRLASRSMSWRRAADRRSASASARASLDAGVVAARRLHRLHRPGARAVRHRHHQAGRLGRAHPHRGLPQRGADLRAERPRADVLPRSGRSGPSLFTIDITGRNELQVPTPSFASDPAWSPLLS